jgi:hypothetical protein
VFALSPHRRDVYSRIVRRAGHSFVLSVSWSPWP